MNTEYPFTQDNAPKDSWLLSSNVEAPFNAFYRNKEGRFIRLADDSRCSFFSEWNFKVVTKEEAEKVSGK